MGKIGDGLASFLTAGGELFARLNDRRDTARPQVRGDLLQPRRAIGEGGEGRLGDPLQPVRRMIPVHDLHSVGIVQPTFMSRHASVFSGFFPSWARGSIRTLAASNEPYSRVGTGVFSRNRA
jgi:hypothetical protein